MRATMKGLATGAALTAMALGGGGCSRSLSYTGYVADQSLASGISPGVDNRASVLATLGRPTFEGQFDAKDWYYVSRQSRQFAFAAPSPVSQTVLHVRFDDADNVASIERSGLEQVARVEPTGRKTPTLGSDRGFFEELFGNIGRVGAPGMQGQNNGSNTGTPN